MRTRRSRDASAAWKRDARIFLSVVFVFLAVLDVSTVHAAGSVSIDYIERRIEALTETIVDPMPADAGFSGVELGVSDSNRGGRFVGVQSALHPLIVLPGEDIRSAVAPILADGQPHFLILNAPAVDVLEVADMPAARRSLIFNIGSADDALRGRDCRANVLHVAASRSMLADALAQFLVFKRWTKILLLSGVTKPDQLYAEALRRGFRKFGLKIVADRSFDAHGSDLRDSPLREFSLLTRASEYDVVAVADEADAFGRQVVYNTDLPRPVVGTHGLSPAAWGPPVEAWAAAQLQSRFQKQAHRWMRPVDYAGWMAAHMIGEAAMQLRSTSASAIRALVVDPKFEIGGFKGRVLSYRSWDGQLREPIFDLWHDAVVATAPLEGFLHPKTDLDTLGIDAPETACRIARGGS